MKKFFNLLLDGIGMVNMFPDTRSIEDILSDYDNYASMKFMLVGFFIILIGLLCGFYLVLKGQDLVGCVLAISTLLLWMFAQIRKNRKNER